MSDKCPKCGAEFSRVINEPDSDSAYWKCHSYRRTFHDETDYFNQSQRCEIRTLRSQLTRLQAEKDEAERAKKCPIGLDSSPQFCSAGSCEVCIGNRLRGLSEELTAATARAEAMEDAIQKIKANSYLDDNVLNRHQFTTTGCEALREAFALLAPAEEVRDGK